MVPACGLRGGDVQGNRGWLGSVAVEHYSCLPGSFGASSGTDAFSVNLSLPRHAAAMALGTGQPVSPGL